MKRGYSRVIRPCAYLWCAARQVTGQVNHLFNTAISEL
jgi:hypothetical protein